jgi:hypothetical protein
MKAMVLRNICNFRENKEPLEMVNLPDSVSGEREINIIANVASLHEQTLGIVFYR